jgi:ABC-2 type transport system permease protein
MNVPSNVIGESRLESHVAASEGIPLTRRIYWSIRRELWENRSIYVAPLAVAALIPVGLLISTTRLPDRMRAVVGYKPLQQHVPFDQQISFAALLIMLTMFLVAVFYCLEALQRERRDRSILFWKSLPVSDLMAVLSKASIPLLIIPLLTFAITIATQSVMLLLSAAVLAATGQSVTELWSHLRFWQMSVMLLYHLVAIHGLWYAPIWSWLLLVSSWARRAAFLWAALPPLAIGVVEKIAFNSSHFGALIGYRLSGGPEGEAFTGASMSMNPLMHLNPGRFLISPGLWSGLLLAAVFLAAAVRLRHYREPV